PEPRPHRAESPATAPRPDAGPDRGPEGSKGRESLDDAFESSLVQQGDGAFIVGDPPILDVVHLVGGARHHPVERDGPTPGLQRVAHLAPDSIHFSGAVTLTGGGQLQHLAFDEPDDVVKSYLLRWFRQRVPALLAPAADDQASVAQFAQDLD